MAYGNISVATSATVIVAKSVSSPPRIALLIKNNSSVVVYLGEDSSVTTSNGYPLQPGDQLILDFDGSIATFFYRDAVYGRVASGTADVRYWQMAQTR